MFQGGNDRKMNEGKDYKKVKVTGLWAKKQD
jgi:hypothetical protein